MNAGRYTQLNMGLIHVQWIWRSREMTWRGISVCIDALPSANSSQLLESSADDDSNVRASCTDAWPLTLRASSVLGDSWRGA